MSLVMTTSNVGAAYTEATSSPVSCPSVTVGAAAGWLVVDADGAQAVTESRSTLRTSDVTVGRAWWSDSIG